MISVQPAKWDMETHAPEIMIRTIVMVIEKLLEDEETQVMLYAAQYNCLVFIAVFGTLYRFTVLHCYNT